MKDTPIIFGTWAIPKLLDDSKTQTRRTQGLEKINKNPDDWQLVAVFQDGLARFYNTKTDQELMIKCPYGGIGDGLWVKETWAIAHPPVEQELGDIITTSLKGLDLEYLSLCCEILYKADGTDNETGWRPSIHMFRWASRIPLEITGIGAERLQGITEADCIAEGVNGYLISRLSGGKDYRAFREYHHAAYPIVDHTDIGDIVRFLGPNFGYAAFQSRNLKCSTGALSIPVKEVFDYIGSLEPDYNRAFKITWDSINTERGYPWEANHWVWPISFRRIHSTENVQGG